MEGVIQIDPTPVWEALIERTRKARNQRGPGGDEDFPSNDALIAFLNGLSDDHFDCLLAFCYLSEGPTMMGYEIVDQTPEVMN